MTVAPLNYTRPFFFNCYSFDIVLLKHILPVAEISQPPFKKKTQVLDQEQQTLR